jgi:D-glycero-D-manno-heptose 1,7-bisphosphate phosphatase
MANKAVFLDKDGTLVRNVPYNTDPRLIRYTEGADEGVRMLHEAGYLLVIVTNQGGVARGTITEEELAVARTDIERHLSGVGSLLSGFYYCPHSTDAVIERYRGDCACRKPNPGMLQQAARDHDIDLRRSWMIGDTLDDIESGKRAGCRTVLMDTAGETLWQLTRERVPDHIVPSLKKAAGVILVMDDACELQMPVSR